MKKIPTIKGFEGPSRIAYDPVHARMYVTNYSNNTVSVIDTNTNKVVGRPITVGNTPRGMSL